MILQNHSLDQDKSFQKLLSLELGYVYLAHYTLIWLKKAFKKLIFLLLFFLVSICKYFTISTCNKPMNLSLSFLKASHRLVMYCTSKMNLHSPDFLSFT